MAQVGRQRSDGVVEVRAVGVPAQETPASEGVAEVVNPWCAGPGLSRAWKIPSELLEGVSDRRGRERRALVRDEERIRLRDRMAAVPEPRVFAQGSDDGGMQRD